jgi:hypothetical protein
MNSAKNIIGIAKSLNQILVFLISINESNPNTKGHITFV